MGGAILVLMAVRALGSALGSPVAETQQDTPRPGGPARGFVTMVALTLTNPATILSFAALFASIGAGTGGPVGALLVVAGVFTGSVTWWAMLTGLVAGLRARLTQGVVRALNVGSALIIGTFGVAAMAIGIAG